MPTKQARCLPTPPGTKPTYRPHAHNVPLPYVQSSTFWGSYSADVVEDQLLRYRLRQHGLWWRGFDTARRSVKILQYFCNAVQWCCV